MCVRVHSSEAVLLAYARRRVEQLKRQLRDQRDQAQQQLARSLSLQEEQDAKLMEQKIGQEVQRMSAEFNAALTRKVRTHVPVKRPLSVGTLMWSPKKFLFSARTICMSQFAVFVRLLVQNLYQAFLVTVFPRILGAQVFIQAGWNEWTLAKGERVGNILSPLLNHPIYHSRKLCKLVLFSQ